MVCPVELESLQVQVELGGAEEGRQTIGAVDLGVVNKHLLVLLAGQPRIVIELKLDLTSSMDRDVVSGGSAVTACCSEPGNSKLCRASRLF